jgi:hypothetical protein
MASPPRTPKSVDPWNLPAGADLDRYVFEHVVRPFLITRYPLVRTDQWQPWPYSTSGTHLAFLLDLYNRDLCIEKVGGMWKVALFDASPPIIIHTAWGETLSLSLCRALVSAHVRPTFVEAARA